MKLFQIRSVAFTLPFSIPDTPLTTESAVVLAISAFSDSAEVHTVRASALHLIQRVISALTGAQDEQGLALCVLAIKRMALFDGCVAFAQELAQLALYKQEDTALGQSQMITSYFEECFDSESCWHVNYGGLFYVLDGVLQLNLTMRKRDVVGSKNNINLLTPLFPLFKPEMLKSVLLNDPPSAEVYISCFAKLLSLTQATVCGADFLLSIIRVLELDDASRLVLHLKSHCLGMVKRLVDAGLLDDHWRRMLPLVSRYLAVKELQQLSLQILSAVLAHKRKAIFVEVLQNNPDISKSLCDVIFDIFSKFKITSLEPHDMLVFGVSGMLCAQVSTCKSTAISAGILEICYEYLLLLSQHMAALARAAGKENVGNARVSRKAGKVADIADAHLLKSLSCVLYCLCCCVDGSENAAVRLTDLDIIATLDHMWSNYSTNIVVLNYVVKLLTLTAQVMPSSIKLLLANKSLLAHVQDSALKSVQFSKHPVTPLRDVLFDFLCVLSTNGDAVSHIWKSGFMAHFPKLEKQRVESEKVGHWLKLIIHGTYNAFGQRMVVSVPHILDILLESAHKYNLLMLVRNLVFNVKSHPKLLTHGSLLDFVVSAVSTDKPKQAVLALQIMLYFIKFSSKAKTVFRNKGAGQVLGKLDLKLKEKENDTLSLLLSEVLSVYN